ncbi:phage major capsid protein [Candidatus Palauibacter sp.]|uniref:phage major capsid protein n=1 Tax=Candidatus Palauibacter sp. TaxID=3101350 RepID=UPI003CC65707
MAREQQIKPFASVDEDIRTGVLADWRGRAASAISGERDRVQTDMERAFEQAGPGLDLEKIDLLGGTMAEKCEKLVALHSELAGLEDALSERRDLERVRDEIRGRNRGGGDATEPADGDGGDGGNGARRNGRRRARLSDLVRADFREQGIDLGGSGFGDRCLGGMLRSDLAVRDDRILNTLFETTAGWAPESVRDPGYTPSLRRPIQLIDILPRTSTTQELVKFMRETTFTNAAAGVAEGDAAPESTLELTEAEVAVRKIATHIPVTREDLEDEPQVESYLNETVPFMVRQLTDELLLTGDGASPNPLGLLGVSGLQDIDWTVESAALSKPLNTLRRAKTKVRYGGRAMATHYVLNPDIWDDIVLSESASGGYYYGTPQSDFVERAWGLPVVLNDHLEGAIDTADDVNGLCGDFSPMWIQLRVRRELETLWGFINDDFIKEIMRIKASIRWALVVKRPQAFVTISVP